MIRKLKLINFKSHLDTELSLGKITLLCGANGCGKSSVIQALLLLRQSYLQDGGGLNLYGNLTRLGTCDDVLCDKAQDGTLGFDLAYDEEEKPYHFRYEIGGSDFKETFVAESGKDHPAEGFKSASLFDKNFQYISALRWGGRSDYLQDTQAVRQFGQISGDLGQCEFTAHFLDVYATQPVVDYYGYGKEKTTLHEQLEKWIDTICSGLSYRVERGDGGRYKLLYNQAGSKENMTAVNVAFGISYTLPILAAVLAAKPGSLLLIENPEAHLHPTAQARLMELLAVAAANGVQIIMETHSDHIVDGLLVACKKGQSGAGRPFTLRREDTSIYFMKLNEEGLSQTQRISIEENGWLDEQPEGFFDQLEHDFNYLNGLSDER